MIKTFRRTRIIATLGPASSNPEIIAKLIESGVDVFRLNFSHGVAEEHKANVEAIREQSAKINRPVGILQDLQGPKIRIGTFVEGEIDLEPGQRFAITCGDNSPGDDQRVGVSYRNLWRDVKPEDILLLDDGRLSLVVTGIRDTSVETKVVFGGKLSNNKGVNIPDSNLSIHALTDKDIMDLTCGAELNVDWVAMSFVRSRDDLLLARHYLDRAGSRAKLMAKIEKPSAVHNFSEILRDVDGIMVARGDLGVEMSSEQVPIIQKRLIRAAREAGKPVVTATQMLETMIHKPYPTRAEASDVANAIHDGTDAVMLSAETAIGDYADEAVRMMDRIARSVEADTEYQRSLRGQHTSHQNTIADSVSKSACEMAHNLSAKVIVTFSLTGTTALRVSRNRCATPVLAITPNPLTYRQLTLCWGVVPILGEEIHTTDDMVEVADRLIRERGLATAGDRYVITAGVPFGVQGTTNLIRVEQLRD
jgi:pyruvate kinase